MAFQPNNQTDPNMDSPEAAPFVFDASKANQPSVGAGTYNAHIVYARHAVSKAGNHMINCRWEIEDLNADDDRAPVVFDRIVFSDGSTFRVVNFMEAVNRSLDEINGMTIDAAFCTEFAETLIGEAASLKIVMKPDSRGPNDDGTPRPDQPNVDKYLPYGSARSSASLLADLD